MEKRRLWHRRRTRGLRCGAGGPGLWSCPSTRQGGDRTGIYDFHGLHGGREKSRQRCTWAKSGDGRSDHRAGQRVIDQGNSVTIRWTPARMRVEGNERADRVAKDAASPPPLRATRRHFSLSFLRRRSTERATQAWRKDIEERNGGRRTFHLPTARSRPGILPQLRRVSKGLAARFFQLLSGHAMTAPFLKNRWGWTDSDTCWWCNDRRQSREHLFKECRAWAIEIRELCTAVGKASGKNRTDWKDPLKAGRVLGIGLGRQGRGPVTHQSGSYCRTQDIPRQF